VHSFILTSSSTFFRGALTGDFKVGLPSLFADCSDILLQEAHKKLIDLSNEEEEYLDRVITFMYTRNYPSQEDKDVLRNAHIYGLALRLDLPFLADMARAQFQCDIFGMSRECINSIFTQLASAIYQHTPEGDEVRKLFVEIMTEVWFVFLEPKVLEEAVKHDPDFAVDLVLKLRGVSEEYRSRSADRALVVRHWPC
jgi:hypothetical protein